MLGVVEHQLQRGVTLLHGIVRGVGHEVVVVELPVEAGAGGVEHPLHDARSTRHVGTERLEHGTGAVVVHEVGLVQEILESRWLTVAAVDDLLQTVEIVHGGSGDGAVVVPHVVQRPEVLADHLLQGLTYRQLCADARLGIEAEGTAGSLSQIPVVGCHIVVGTRHLHAREAGHLTLGVSGRDEMGTVVGLLQDIDIPALKVGMRQKVAAHEPGDNAGMTAQPAYLVAEGAADKGDVVRADDAAILLVDGFTKVLCPLPLTAPAREHEQTVAVAEVVDILRRAPHILEADAVEVHITHVAHLYLITLGRIAQKNVVCPSGTSYQHVLAVEGEATIALRGMVVLDLTDAEGELLVVGHHTVGDKLKGHVVEFGLAHVIAPPQTGILHMQGLEVADAEVAHLTGREGDRRSELTAVELSAYLALHRLVREVAKRSTDGEPGLLEGLQVDLRLHTPLAYGHITRTDDAHLTEQSHRLIERTRVPVHKADVRITRLCTEHLDCQFVLGLRNGGDVEDVAAERAAERVLRGDEGAVHIDVGTVADAVEHQEHMLLGAQILQGEVAAVPPRAVEGLGVVLLVGHTLEDALVEAVLGERAHDGGRHLGVIRFLSDRALHFPAVAQHLLRGIDLHGGHQHGHNQQLFHVKLE